jgi:hypothetical protein
LAPDIAVGGRWESVEQEFRHVDRSLEICAFAAFRG